MAQAPKQSQTGKLKQVVEGRSSALDYLDEGVFIDWISRYKNAIFYGLVIAVALLILFFRFSSGSRGKAEVNYLQAAKEFQIAVSPKQQDPSIAEHALSQLNAMMDQYPELHAAYDGTIAQTLLSRGQVAEAQPYAASTLERTRSDELSFYRSFAQTTLLIAQQKYEEARNQALSLQQKMEELLQTSWQQVEMEFGEELFTWNLFRIGMLSQLLGDRAGELKAWNEWRQYAGLDEGGRLQHLDAQDFLIATQALAIGTTTLSDYIDQRLKVLKSSPTL